MIVNIEVIVRVLMAFLAIAQNNIQFDDRDVQRVNETNHWWVKRFALVNQNEDQALKALIKCMEWRKDIKINDINDTTFPQELNDLELIKTDKKDKEGRPMMWFTLNRFLQSEVTKMTKEYTAYKIETLDKQTSHEGWGIIIDGTDAGLLNMDLAYFRDFVTILQKYYPLGIKYMVFVNLPIFLDSTSRLLIALSNHQMKNKIKILSNQHLIEYLNPDLIPEHLKVPSDHSLIAHIFG